MKQKSKKKRAVCFLILIIAAGFFGLHFFQTMGMPLKLLMGTAQILYKTDASVYTNQQLAEGAAVFRMPTKLNGEKTDRYLLWLPRDRKPSFIDEIMSREDFRFYHLLFIEALFRDIFMIDKSTGKVGLPNTSSADYQLYFNRFLVQANGSDWFIPFSDDVKGAGFDPDLAIDEKVISFNVPSEPESYLMDGCTNIRIEFEN